MTGQAVNAVQSVDQTFLVIFGISALILVGITVAMVYFVIRYSRARHPVPADFDGNLIAEIIWTVVPTLLVLGMFYYGWESFRALRGIPAGAMEVKVTARQWSWSFAYQGGRQAPELWVPTGRPVKLTLNSTDVIHGFYAPAFRVKIDVVPGLTTYAWFQAEQPGDYDIFCSVYCGLQHAKMLSRIHAVSPEEFERWLARGQAQDQGQDGQTLLEKHGCLGCHTTDGSPSVGPTLKDIAGRQVVLAAPGGGEITRTVDEDYLRQAILGGKGGTVKGFEPLMPPYQGQIPEEELRGLLDFLLGRQSPPPLDGAKIAEEQGCLGCHSNDGSPLVGPSFAGLFGGKSKVLDQGREVEVTVDAQFILQTLADPMKRPTKGFDPVMPAYPDLSPREKEALLDYLRSLGQGDHEGHVH
jgi:cytochrome c oxidase subunit 2